MSLKEPSTTLLMAGDNWSEVVERAASVLPPASAVLLALSARRRTETGEPLAAALAERLGRAGRRVEMIAAPAGAHGWLSSRRVRWTTVDLDGRGDRLNSAMLPERLMGGDQIVVLNDLRFFDPNRPAIAIGVWAQFAHPRQRFGASISGQADGLTAEIALAAPPAWYLIAASWMGKPMAVLANDMISAELVGLAIGQAQADPDHERSGPWEHPLVQRATDFNLGARTPAGINFASEWLGSSPDLSAGFLVFGEAIAARIGISTGPK